MMPRCLLLISVFIALQNSAAACPRISGLIDYNCDHKLKFVFVGDSIVSGKGDHKSRGGYVGRLKKYYAGRAEVTGLGYSGYSSGRLLQEFTNALNGRGDRKIQRGLRNADFILIDVGRNDYWDKDPYSFTARNIMRLSKLLETRVGRNLRRGSPFVSIALLLPTKRMFQRTFIAGVNDELFALPSAYHVDLRFDRVQIRNISFDGVHPTPAGHKAIMEMVRKYIKGPLQRKEKKLRPPTSAAFFRAQSAS